MKNSKYILIFLIIGLVSFSCKKTEANPIDYRDKYVGTYMGVATRIHSYYTASSTFKDTTINNDSIVTITKIGDYPSKKISLNGYTAFTLENSNKNNVGGGFGYTYVEFKFPTIHFSGSGSGSSYEYYEWDFKGIKQ